MRHLVADIHFQCLAFEDQVEPDAVEDFRQARPEAQLPIVIAHSGKAIDEHHPHAPQGGNKTSNLHVTLDIAQVHQGGGFRIFQGLVHLVNFGSHDALYARG
jgi:hypothetical protein